MVCDLTIAADNAIFGQTGPKVLTLIFLSHMVYVSLLENYLNELVDLV